MTLPAKPFDEAAILAQARASDGLEDFGDERFREPLGLLLASFAQVMRSSHCPPTRPGSTESAYMRQSVVLRLAPEGMVSIGSRCMWIT